MMGFLSKILGKGKTDKIGIVGVDWERIKAGGGQPGYEELLEKLGASLYDAGVGPSKIFDKVPKAVKDTIFLPENTTRVEMAYAARAVEKGDMERAVRAYHEAGRLGWGMGLEDPAAIDVLGNAYKNPELAGKIEKAMREVIKEEYKKSMGSFYKDGDAESSIKELLGPIKKEPLSDSTVARLLEGDVKNYKNYVKLMESDSKLRGYWEPPSLKRHLDHAMLYSRLGYFDEKLKQKVNAIKEELDVCRKAVQTINES